MEPEKPLAELRRRVGIEAALIGVTSQPEVAKSLAPAVEHILQNLGAAPRLQDASKLTDYSPFAFSRAFKRAAGMGFHEFHDRARVDEALLRTEASNAPVKDIAQELGYMSVITLDLSLGEYTGLPLATVLSQLRP